MMTVIYVLILIAALGGGAWLAWRYFGAAAGLFGSTRDSRIGVSETISIDGKRKLLLIHRDGVEHLIMTGGPIDIVIEQGIMEPGPQMARRSAGSAAPAPAGYEPRLPNQAAAYVSNEANAELPAGFGRLRQRGASGQAQDPRPDPAGFSSGGGQRS